MGRNINSFINELKPNLISSHYNAEGGKLIFDVCSAQEFNDVFVLKDDILVKYTEFLKNDFYRINSWCNQNKDLAHNNSIFKERIYVDQMTAYGVMQHWMKYKQVYKFSKPLMEALDNTEMNGINWDFFKSMPYPDLYIDFSSSDSIYNGCFVHSNDNSCMKNPNVHTLSIIAIDKKIENIIGILYVDIPNECEKSVKEIARTGFLKSLNINGRQLVERVINCLVYITVQNDDIRKDRDITVNRFYTDKKGKRRKQKTTTQVWDVGYRKTSYINYNNSDGQESKQGGGTVRPHLRRGHWHKHWVGPRDNKKLIPMWQPPTFVNCKNTDTLPTVEHGVKDE